MLYTYTAQNSMRRTRADFSSASTLLHNWEEWIYTDGSKQDIVDPATNKVVGTATGSGIYVPPKRNMNNVDPTLGTSYKIDPEGDPITNTINRAELVAIYKAIDLGLGNNIASDSASSIYQIIKQIRHPRLQNKHKHRPLLDALADLIRNLPASQCITLIKVKAHSGLVGNWHADVAAKQAAQAKDQVQYTVDNHSQPPWGTMHWPYHSTTETQEEQNPPSVPTQLQPFENINAALKSHLLRIHRLGASNQRTVYHQSLQRTAPLAVPEISHKFMRDKRITPAERRHTLQYRYGGLYTTKLAFRYGHAPSPNCTLCGQMDGGHHSVSGCPAVNKLVIERHNGAARHILKAIADGQLGGALIMSDVGNAKKMAEAGFETRPATRIPQHILPQIEDTLRNSLRPDGLLVANAGQPIPERKVYIIEVKYAADTDTENQESNANQQHEQLQQIMHQAGYDPDNITRANIILGVGGTIFKDNITTLDKLGVGKRAAEVTLTKVHRHSVKWLHKIFTYKFIRSKQNIPRQGVG